MKVTLIGRPEMTAEMKSKIKGYRDFTNGRTYSGEGPINLVEFAGRVCYDSHVTGRPSAAYFANILEQEHYSVLEHLHYVFFIEEVPLTLTHELVRHRHLSFSQRSTRYCEPYATNVGVENYDACLALYKAKMADMADILPIKVKRGWCRKVMPVGSMTELVCSGNVRTWREVLSKRISPAADADIRDLCDLIREILVAEVPELFNV